jgi:hypothetical protein
LDLLTHIITALSLISALYTSLQHQPSLCAVCCVFSSHSLATVFTVEILQLPALRSSCHSRPYGTLDNSLSTANYLVAISSHLSSQSSTLDSQFSTDSFIPRLAWGPRYITSGRTQQKTPLPKNPSIVACVFVAAGRCLPSRCLAMNAYSCSTIPAFRCHFTIPFYATHRRY